MNVGPISVINIWYCYYCIIINVVTSFVLLSLKKNTQVINKTEKTLKNNFNFYNTNELPNVKPLLRSLNIEGLRL